MSPDQKTQKCKQNCRYSLPRVLLQYAALKDTLVSDGTTCNSSPVRVSQTRTILAILHLIKLFSCPKIMNNSCHNDDNLSMNEMYDWVGNHIFRDLTKQ